METFSRPLFSFSGPCSAVADLKYPNMQLCIHNHARYQSIRFLCPASVASTRIGNLRNLSFASRRSSTRIVSFAERSPQTNYNDYPGWLNLTRDFSWNPRSLVNFLIEQPSQLKYIEWPSLLSTMKTAALTLVLVALFIVALASVDSALSYLLALFLRRKA